MALSLRFPELATCHGHGECSARIRKITDDVMQAIGLLQTAPLAGSRKGRENITNPDLRDRTAERPYVVLSRATLSILT